MEKHGVFWVEKPKMKGASSAGASSSAAFSASLSLPAGASSAALPAALDWSGWMEPAALALPAAFRQRIESLELIIDFCLGELEADEEGGDLRWNRRERGRKGGVLALLLLLALRLSLLLRLRFVSIWSAGWRRLALM